MESGEGEEEEGEGVKEGEGGKKGEGLGTIVFQTLSHHRTPYLQRPNVEDREYAS